jgi:hypothetical protein
MDVNSPPVLHATKPQKRDRVLASLTKCIKAEQAKWCQLEFKMDSIFNVRSPPAHLANKYDFCKALQEQEIPGYDISKYADYFGFERDLSAVKYDPAVAKALLIASEQYTDRLWCYNTLIEKMRKTLTQHMDTMFLIYWHHAVNRTEDWELQIKKCKLVLVLQEMDRELTALFSEDNYGYVSQRVSQNTDEVYKKYMRQ